MKKLCGEYLFIDGHFIGLIRDAVVLKSSIYMFSLVNGWGMGAINRQSYTKISCSVDY